MKKEDRNIFLVLCLCVGLFSGVTISAIPGNEIVIDIVITIAIASILVRDPDERCFIATTAYGTLLNENLDTLRNFRDTKLNTNIFGKTFVKFYYQYLRKCIFLVT